VFGLARALRKGFSAPGVDLAVLHLAPGAVGVAVSPNGQSVYVTTFGGFGPHGRLWVIDAARAEAGNIAHAVLGSTPAGCQPVRVALAPDGSEVYVTALQSNALLAFSAKALQTRPRSALQAVVPVGSEPVGLTLADHGQIALIADSNRGLVPSSTRRDQRPTISVVSTHAALAHQTALIGDIRAGLFPRDLSFDSRTGEVQVANFSSDTVEEFKAPSP
jgi:DNA-binding beta-propeller fold protein YncE